MEKIKIEMLMKDQNQIMLEVISKPNNLNSIAKDAFAVADKDNNGFIDIEEFGLCMKNVCDSFGLMTPEKDNIKSEFDRLDTDKNGSIDFEEFKQYVKEIINQMLFT